MTNENSYREKGRALFLAAMMVLSVVAMSAAFAGAAAAVNEETVDDGPTFDSNDIDEVWIGQQITLETSSTNEFDGLVSIAEGPFDSEDSPDDTIETNDSDTNGDVILETDDLEDGEYYQIHSHANNDADFHGETFQAVSEDPDVEFDSNSVSEEGQVDIEFESERDADSQDATANNHQQDVNVSSDDIDGGDLHDLLVSNDEAGGDDYSPEQLGDGVVLQDLDDDETITMDLTGELDTGEYEFTFNVTDSLAETNATIEVTDDDEDRYIVDNDDPEQGDIANVTIGVEETDEAIVSFGDYDGEGHQSVIALENIDDDEIVLQYNTAYADASGEQPWSLYNSSQADVVEVVAENMQDHNSDEEMNITSTDLEDDEALPSGSWDIGIGTYDDGDGNVGVDNIEFNENFDDGFDEDAAAFLAENIDQDDRDSMLITDRAPPADAVLQTAADDYDVSDIDGYDDAHVTATDVIATDYDNDDLVEANGDSLFLSVEDVGADGVFNDLDEDVSGAELYEATGISIEVVEQETGAVGDATNWNSSADGTATYEEQNDPDNHLDIDVHSLEDYEGDLIIEINYHEHELEIDESYDVYFNVTEDFYDDDAEEYVNNPFTEEDYSGGAEISFEEPEVEWDEIDELGNSSTATAYGETNVAPGTELDADADSDEGNFIETTDVNVSDDGTFGATFDLSDEAAGVEMDLSVQEPLTDEDDELGGVQLVEADDDDDDEDEEEGISLGVDYDDIEVGEDAHIDATVDNNDENETSVDVTLEINDESYDQTLDIDGDDSATAEFTVEDLDVGDYDFSVDADSDDDSASYDGTLTVEEEGVDDDDAPADDEDDADDDDAPEDDDDDDDDDDDGTPGFGVAVALVALLSAAMLALRRQD